MLMVNISKFSIGIHLLAYLWPKCTYERLVNPFKSRGEYEGIGRELSDNLDVYIISTNTFFKFYRKEKKNTSIWNLMA